jgi:hypothetical protein
MTEKIDNTSADSQNEEDTDKEQGGASPETTTDERTKDFPMDDLKQSELEALEAISQSSVQSDSLRTREEIKQIHDLMESMKVINYSGLEIAGCQWPKAGHILEMADKNKYELASQKKKWQVKFYI